ncbi:MAG: hypothetical protein KF817_06810 [Phycisphaeraceae bacterium]|nr:hypothetical protein [Phycisphaeraceae bacterium]
MSAPLGQFSDIVHPAVARDIAGWTGAHPLAPLRETLRSHQRDRTFLDLLAEAIIARTLLAEGCALTREAPTPEGRGCDFRVVADDQSFYVHVKRLVTDGTDRQVTISARLRLLERIMRPYIVSVRWRDGVDDRQMQRLVREAEEFIRHARVGDELVVHDDADGSEIGGVLIVAPWDRPHVSVMIGLPEGFADETIRMRRLLARAWRQFMPRARNVIILATSHERDAADMDAALLGSHEERWDRFPPRGSRIAHGRAEDGFWNGDQREDSRWAGWFRFDPAAPDLHVRLWFRDAAGEASPFGRLLRRVLHADGASAAPGPP